MGRLTLKASTCAMLARLLGHVTPEHALLASLLSEVGTLAVLSAFREETEIPSGELYYKLCREYSKSLGVIVLKKWAVNDEYIAVIRAAGNWSSTEGRELGLIDLVNLALFHAIKERNADADLPLLVELAAFHKLLPPLNFIGDNGELELVVNHRADIHALAETLY